MRAGGSFALRSEWRNAGVAPCLPGGHPAATLKDSDGGIAGVFVDDGFEARSLPVGAPGEAGTRSQRRTFALPFILSPGRYDLFVSIGTRTGTPRIALPLGGHDGERRYRLGEISVTGDYAVSFGRLRRKGERHLLPMTWTVQRALPANVRPFFHFDREGLIRFQGFPEPDSDLDSLTRPGAARVGCVFEIPGDARGERFAVKVGLWVPERIGRPDERMLPDEGEPDRRVVAGELRVDRAGRATFRPSSGSM